MCVIHVLTAREVCPTKVFQDGFRGLCQQTIPPGHNRDMLLPAASQYRFEAVSVPAFVQQLAVSYVGRGYWFYVAGTIPEGKDTGVVDRKLIDRYGVGVSKWSRARRKSAGLANVHYLRHRQFFVLIATKGVHRFFELEPNFRDIRRVPLKFCGYSIGCSVGREGAYHPSVRIECQEFRALKRHFLRSALTLSAREIAEELGALPYEPYAPVRRQFLELLRAINRRRSTAGAEPVPFDALRLRRRPVRVFPC